MDISKETVWRMTAEQNWLLYTNTNAVLPEAMKPNTDKLKNTAKTKDLKNVKKDQKETKGPFYFAKIKHEAKGTMVYTPKGYGIVQSIKTDQGIIAVKVNNEISEFTKSDILMEIPITLIFVSNSGKSEDKALIPINSTIKDVLEKVDRECEAESVVARSVYYKGRELSKSNESIEKMGITPFSRFIVTSGNGKPYKVNRFQNIFSGWGYNSKAVDAVSFTASKNIRIIGFATYAPSAEAALNGSLKFVEGGDASGRVLASKEVSITPNKDPEDKFFVWMFDTPVRIKAGESYSCVVELKGGNSWYGSTSVTTTVGEEDVTFTFTDCTGSNNCTCSVEGQIPEIYYYL
jgi:hypothetical protein